uniref:alpha-1,2-Mannosidase n=1 Tax=Steinernema glaseri TaxID=37863 RepID=A0A1I8AAM6_9BILA
MVRLRERYFVIFGLFLIVAICVVSLFFLPCIDCGNATRVLIRSALNRPAGRTLDGQKLREKIEKALPPPDAAALASLSNAERRAFIKKMMKFGWDNYKTYAWGANELRPLSRTGHSASIFGNGETGATIIDALDTLYIMELSDEYEVARRWVSLNLDFSNTKGELSVFETNIRFIGGLLSAYGLTNDTMFIDKARAIADVLLPAFDTPTGIPFALVNVQRKTAENWNWASGGASILSEFGSLQLEFDYLSNVTQNRIYSEKVARVREVLESLNKPDGLYPNYLNPRTGKWGQQHVSVGALGDSFYEYLLKAWLISDKRDVQAKKMYDDAVDALEKKLLFKSEQNQLWYFAEKKGSRIEHKMDHLACFVVGMFALQSKNELDPERSSHFLELAEKLADTCHESYIRTDTRIGPESFRFTRDAEAVAINEREKYYILRPEVIEGWFYLWRITGDAKYREWCWEAAVAIETHCRTAGGYSGIRNVYSTNVSHDDVQQSFVFAETFKYLYLVFSEESVIPLDRWVFNTEAHPFPVRFSANASQVR